MEDIQITQLESAAIFKKTNFPVTLKFENVVYKIKPKTEGMFNNSSKSQEEKIILRGITGIVFPGEMLAMLGPSGSGKTTLLTGLGGRLSGRLEGTITYNGMPFKNAMKRYTGFVTQDDVLYPHLTVTETLVYTALLRLPKTLSHMEKVAHAEAVISQLGLMKCKDSIIGGPLLRGISGGERKRVSIGQEMLINPSLLFLDEPTSGLDSTTAQKIVSTLWELVNGGRTIVMTIHQPSSRLFYMFHKVLLLSEGNPLYFGRGEDVMAYFSSIGFSPSVAMNPSDFLLDLANGVIDDPQEDQASIKQTLVTAFKTNLLDGVKEELQKYDDSEDHEKLQKGKLDRWSNTWWNESVVLFRRGMKERKHDSFSFLKVGQVLIVSILCAMLWWRSSDIQDQTGLMFFITSFWGFYPLFQAIFTFPPERMMLEKERSSGMYRLSSYFMSRIVGDLPMELVLPTVFVIITYWTTGLKQSSVNFFSTLFTVLYGVLVAQGLGLAIGAMIMDLKSATVLASVIMLSFTLVSGFFVQHVPSFISWLKYISLSQYTFKLLIGSQYEADEMYHCGIVDATCYVHDFPAIKSVGLGGKAISVVALTIMLVGYRLLAYLVLTRIGVTKK
ncbi:hypothetical protein MTR67_033142 [Solanum verrucosum]|uniref:ABC transporter domain-containing protein n=1 Tax=Solanum verrucosum TaxID=315347 RepID=A0AAF0U5I5_SOLVR|nr:hypothetical protein MTR67_033142 [Solanum verrucosum]